MCKFCSGSASFSIGGLSAGSHNITAVHDDDANDIGITSDVVTQTVNPVTNRFTIVIRSTFVLEFGI
jgi:hypothetical protein